MHHVRLTTAPRRAQKDRSPHNLVNSRSASGISSSLSSPASFQSSPASSSPPFPETAQPRCRTPARWHIFSAAGLQIGWLFTLKFCTLVIFLTSPGSGQQIELKADRCDNYRGPTRFYCGARKGAISTSTCLRMIEESHSFRLLLLTSSDDHEILSDVRNYRVLAIDFLPRPFCRSVSRRQALQVLLLCHFIPHRGAVL
jgi:hypothetical protein